MTDPWRPPARSCPPTSPTLLARLADGSSPMAWDEFFGIYGPVLWSYARRRGCAEATAEDLVQDVMLKIFQRRDVFRYDPARGRFRDWLGTVVRNRVAECRRRPQERARPSPDGAPPEREVDGPGPDAAWEEMFERGLLAAALDVVRSEVEPRDYLAFELTALEGLEPARAAETAGLSRNAVYKARRRILARLRDLLGPYEDEGRLTGRLRHAMDVLPPGAAERSLTARVTRRSAGEEGSP